jgi:hypothetical protein
VCSKCEKLFAGSDKGSYYAQHEKNCKKKFINVISSLVGTVINGHNMANGHNEFDFEIIPGLNITLHLCSLNFPAISTKIYLAWVSFPTTSVYLFLHCFLGVIPNNRIKPL